MRIERDKIFCARHYASRRRISPCSNCASADAQRCHFLATNDGLKHKTPHVGMSEHGDGFIILMRLAALPGYIDIFGALRRACA